jgi:predicted nucleic acid-binding protein
MSSGLLDSSILIDCLRGRSVAVGFVAARAASGPVPTHVIVAAELLAGARDKREQRLIDSFLRTFSIVSPVKSDGLAALDLYRQYHLSHGVDWPDCQIAATAIRLGVEVFTLNVKHFSAFAGLRVVRGY